MYTNTNMNTNTRTDLSIIITRKISDNILDVKWRHPYHLHIFHGASYILLNGFSLQCLYPTCWVLSVYWPLQVESKSSWIWKVRDKWKSEHILERTKRNHYVQCLCSFYKVISPFTRFLLTTFSCEFLISINLWRYIHSSVYDFPFPFPSHTKWDYRNFSIQSEKKVISGESSYQKL